MEKGTHSELIERQGVYFTLVTLQNQGPPNTTNGRIYVMMLNIREGLSIDFNHIFEIMSNINLLCQTNSPKPKYIQFTIEKSSKSSNFRTLKQER